MQLRRFTADSTPAALGAVRHALGDDAIILANRKIGDQVEIIATGQMEDAQALAEISLDGTDAGASSSKRADSGSRKKSAEADRDLGSTSFEELTAAIDAVAPQAESSDYEGGRRTTETSQTLAESAQIDRARPAIGVDRQNSENAILDHAVSPARAVESKVKSSKSNGIAAPVYKGINESTLQSDMQKLTLDLDDMVERQNKQLLRIIETQSNLINDHFKGLEVNLWGNSCPNRRIHLQRLLSMGIGAELAIQLAERTHPGATVDEALRQSFALLKSTLPIGVDKTFTVPGVTIFTGPPGAGKTTALMKVATQHVKESGSDSIVIICADTRRIGAFEELQAYGRLLGVPTVHAHDSSELDSLLVAFTHKQLILIDHTLPMDDDAVEIPRRLLKPDVADSVRQLLVLSATCQSATIDALIRLHCEGRSMQCVLTHLDASARLGEMFNAIIRHHLPIAYWSDAASVQTPLQKAEASVLIATAAAMSRRIAPTPDDEWLMRLIQPSDQLVSPPVYARNKQEVNA